MHILFLTQIVPYPPDAGPKIKTWQVLRYLAEIGHQISLATFVRPEERDHLPALEKYCSGIYPIAIQRSRLADIGYWLKSQFTGRPFLVERDKVPAMSQLVRDLMSENSIDVIHADQITMAQYAMPLMEMDQAVDWKRIVRSKNGNSSDPYRTGSSIRPGTVFDAHNAVWMIVRRVAETAPVPLRPIIRLEANRLRRYEGKIVRAFDHTITVSESDKQAMLEALHVYDQSADPQNLSPMNRRKPQISVVPIAVDSSAEEMDWPSNGSSNILAIGTLHYPPNADGVRWFANEVLPFVWQDIPDATLTIVGKNPPRDIQRMERHAGGSIHVTGYVDDLDPYLEKAALMVVPVRAGGGMRVRILEGLARGIPMVTTTVGLEGIEAIPEREILVADEPAEFARSVVRLIRDEQLRNSLARRGQTLIERKYDRRIALEPLLQIYGRTAMEADVPA
ncbi:MAG: glycosyltransferase [Anaerolineales bacterium]